MARSNAPENVESLLDDLGGCGKFQAANSLFMLSVKTVSGMSMMFMAFGNYNPGWLCYDNSTITFASDHHQHHHQHQDVAMGTLQQASSPTNSTVPDDDDYEEDARCRVFESCLEVRFSPGSRTVVSEWRLVCDRAWIPSLIISLQMVGVLVGSYLSGCLADRFGRKRIVYAANACHLLLNAVAVFSNSWQCFAALRFLIGVTIAMILLLPVVHTMEFAHFRWRNFISCAPTFTSGCLLFALVAWLTEDWRYLHAITAAASLVTLIPCPWVPESLRWLVVKGKMENAMYVVNKIARLNGVESPHHHHHQRGSGDCLREIAVRYKETSRLSESSGHSCLGLMQPGLRYTTVALAFVMVCFSLIYYSITFGVASLPGNLYTNMAIMYGLEIPASFVSSPLPNYVGRKRAVVAFLFLCTASLCWIVALDRVADGDLKNVGTLVGALFARVTADCAWDVTNTYTAEIYPTGIRSTGVAFASWTARIGGISAPYFIPNDPGAHFVNYSIMACCALVCCVLLAFFPETKGRPMPDVETFKGGNKGELFRGGNVETSKGGNKGETDGTAMDGMV